MDVFALSQNHMHDGSFVREYKACPADILALDSCYIKLAGEYDELRKHFQAVSSTDSGDIPALRVFPEQILATASATPWRLGRQSMRPTKDNETQVDGLVLHEADHNPLLYQLQALHARRGKSHYRIAIVNGFGGKLGDTLVGTTAFRHVRKVMSTILPDFSCDMLVGLIISNPNIRECYKFGEVDNVVFFGPTVEDFCAYDAYFDFSSLLLLPRFHSMPMVDWYIWWMGLEPDGCTPADKRNRLCIEADTITRMQARLETLPGQKKVFFNPLASVPLRSFPPELYASFVLRLLEEDKALTLIVNVDIAVEHERLVRLEGTLSLAQYQSLIACVDGVIGMNTYSTHVADATATPCVQLCAVLPPSFLPYYPLLAALNIPDYTTLPGHLLAKVDDERWLEMRDAYTDAWSRLDAGDVVRALTSCIEMKKLAQITPNIFPLGSKKHSYLYDLGAMPHSPLVPYLMRHEAWSSANRIIVELLDQYMKIGSHVVTAGLTDFAAISLFAAKIYDNSLTVLDSRDYVAQRMMHYCQCYCMRNVRVTTASLSEHMSVKLKPDFDPDYALAAPYESNTHRQHTVMEIPLDSLHNRTDILVVQPPHSLKDVLAGGQKTLRKYAPLILVGPQRRDQMSENIRDLQAYGYAAYCRVLDTGGEFYFVMAAPKGSTKTIPHDFKFVSYGGFLPEMSG